MLDWIWSSLSSCRMGVNLRVLLKQMDFAVRQAVNFNFFLFKKDEHLRLIGRDRRCRQVDWALTFGVLQAELTLPSSRAWTYLRSFQNWMRVYAGLDCSFPGERGFRVG